MQIQTAPIVKVFPNIVGNAGWSLWSMVLQGLGYIQSILPPKELDLHGLTKTSQARL